MPYENMIRGFVAPGKMIVMDADGRPHGMDADATPEEIEQVRRSSGADLSVGRVH